MKKFRQAAVLTATSLLGLGIAAQGPQYRGSNTDAMGRSGTASITGPSAMYLNPAGLAGLQGYGGEFELETSVNGTLLDYAKWAADNSQYFSHFDSLLAHMDTSLENVWAPYHEAYMIQGHYKDLAFSLSRSTRTATTLAKSVLTPAVGAAILSDLQLVAGRGFALPDDWNVGFSVKYLYRQRADEKLYGPNDDEYYAIKGCLEGSSSSLTDKYDKITCASRFADAQYGFGLNMGVSRQLPYGFAIGASLLDLPTFFNGGFIYPQANVGGAYALNIDPIPGIEAVRYKLLMNLDWQSPLTDEDWFRQWKTGGSFSGIVKGHDVAVLSFGLNEGYPTIGGRVGYILYAYYLYTSQETGYYPGQRGESFHRFGTYLSLNL
jgi:hypothetical protein